MTRPPASGRRYHQHREPSVGDRRPSPSPSQQRVLRFVAEGSGHGVVEATAGSGKTTTLVQVAQLLPKDRPACFLAFNRATAAELKARLPTQVEATTIHALGRRILLAAFPQAASATPDSDKYVSLALVLVRQRRPAAGQPHELAEYLAQLAGFVRLATGAELRAPPAAEVAVRHGLESPVTAAETPALQRLVAPLLELGLQRVESGSFDFTDMLYAPLRLGTPPPSYHFVCVDEAQDLSPLTLALVMRLIAVGARALFVGDPKQAIYAFAGADSRSLDRITATTSSTVLPLSVSFRCPSRHVALARRFSPAMEAAPGAVAGSVRLIPLAQLARTAEPGDLVMSRVNAPLVGQQLRLVEAGTPTRVLGNDLAEPTVALARHLFGATSPGAALSKAAADLVAQHARDEAERLERVLLTSQALGAALRISEERHTALSLVLRQLLRLPQPSFAELEALTFRLLAGRLPPLRSGNEDRKAAGEAGQVGSPASAGPGHPLGPHVQPVRPVVLSTIHRAKGREAERVFLLFPEELVPGGDGDGPAYADEGHTEQHASPASGSVPAVIPAASSIGGANAAPDADAEAEAEAEGNLLFVALTRAKRELVLVERTEGALAARLARAAAQVHRSGARDEGPQQALAVKWNQVLSLAVLMAGARPTRRWWQFSRSSRGAPPRA